MPATRSQAAASGPPSETLGTPPPPTLIHSNRSRPHSVTPSHAAPSSVERSGPATAPHAMPLRRRSVRLASLSTASTGSDAPIAAKSSGKRNLRGRDSGATDTPDGSIIVSESDTGEINVSEAAEESSSSAGGKKRVFDDSVGGMYMSLRSGSKIARRELQMSIDTNEVQTQKSASGAQCVEESSGKINDVNMVAEGVEEKGGGETFSRQDEGKVILVLDPVELELVKVNQAKRQADQETKGKEKLVMGEASLPKHSNVDMVAENSKEKVGEGRLSRQEKGKGLLSMHSVEHRPVKVNQTRGKAEQRTKMKDELVMERDLSPVNELDFDMVPDLTVVKDVAGHSKSEDGSSTKRRPQKAKDQIDSRKEADRSRAIELAPKYAFFNPEEDGNLEEEEQEDLEELFPDAEPEDWPGPFSTAMKIIQERDEKLRARESNSSAKKDENCLSRISWMPSKNLKPLGRQPPTLRNLCMKVLLDNAEEIESLDGIPDTFKHRLITKLCHSRKMSSRLLGLLVCGTPTEVCLSDCSWASEGLFEEVFSQCNMKCLKVMQLDMCGRCLPDYVLRATLAKCPNSLPSLNTISLKGAYRLSDDGLNAIASAAPSLYSVNLSKCSILTSSGIINIIGKLGLTLKELYIDDCQNVDAMSILPALKKLIHLQVLSVAGIDSVCDKFVHQLIPICGLRMKEIIIAGCPKLTTASIKTISAHCPGLCAIDLQNLKRLNDSAIAYLANGCRSLQKLKLRRNAFSDEAVAAFLEASGGSLIELSLNNVTKVAQQTALAISRQCFSTLYSLDLSFCREMTDEALGLIVDSCSSLKTLKLFGCTQVTEVFFLGHSNPSVKIIGCQGKLLDEIDIPF